jgi:selenocysteine lyase/cysteine desulfurase
MEAGLAALLEPGETVIVGIAGYFGRRIAEVASRQGARVVEVVVAPGEHVPEERLLEVVRAHPGARAVAVVQAETSTGVRQPLENLGAALRSDETLLFVDCVTSLGGIELEPERWGIDYCYSCTQKCLGAPAGMSPVRLSQRALERLHARRAPPEFRSWWACGSVRNGLRAGVFAVERVGGRVPTRGGVLRPRQAGSSAVMRGGASMSSAARMARCGSVSWVVCWTAPAGPSRVTRCSRESSVAKTRGARLRPACSKPSTRC